MRFLSALLVSLLAGLVSGDSIPGLPKCAGSCLSGDNFGGCKINQVQCICSNKPFLAGLACCVSKNCDAADQEKTIQFAKALCQAEGHVTDLPTTATCASTATNTGTGTTSSATSTSASAGSTSSNAANLGRVADTGLAGLLMAGLAVAL